MFGREGLVPLAQARFVAPRTRASVLGLMQRDGVSQKTATKASPQPPAATGDATR